MRTKIIAFTISVFALGLVVSFGCGGTSGGAGEEYIGPVTRVTIKGSSASGLQYYDTDGVNQDVTGIASGEGDAGDGINSGSDLASASCMFSADAESVNGYIQVVDSIVNCESLNACVICMPSATDNECSIECEGYIPSNAASAADSIDIEIRFTHDFKTDMVDPGGLVRFDGEQLAWEEFEPNDETLGMQYVLTGCDGDDDYLTVEDDPLLAWLDEDGASYWKRSFEITAVDPDEDAGPTLGLSTCVIQQYMVARMALTGADTPGTLLDLTRGSVWLHGQICADQENCPTPDGAREPTP